MRNNKHVGRMLSRSVAENVFVSVLKTDLRFLAVFSSLQTIAASRWIMIEMMLLGAFLLYLTVSIDSLYYGYQTLFDTLDTRLEDLQQILHLIDPQERLNCSFLVR